MKSSDFRLFSCTRCERSEVVKEGREPKVKWRATELDSDDPEGLNMGPKRFQMCPNCIQIAFGKEYSLDEDVLNAIPLLLEFEEICGLKEKGD